MSTTSYARRLVAVLAAATLAVGLAVPAEAQTLSGGAASTSSSATPAYKLAAARILRSASRLQPLPAQSVMATPPTITYGAASAATPITTAGNTGATSITGVTDTPVSPRIAQIGGLWGLNGNGNGYQNLGITSGYGPANQQYRSGQVGSGFAFNFDGQVFAVAVNATATERLRLRVTDLDTGVRAWATLADIVPTPSPAYTQFDFGSRGRRMVEVFVGRNAVNVYGFAFHKYDQVSAAQYPDEARVVIVGDSYQAGTNYDHIRDLPGYVAGETMGARTVTVMGVAGTGYLNDASGASRTFVQRVQAGDLDSSRIGHQDLVAVVGSVNDNLSVSAAYTDASVQAAVTTFVSALMVAQPRAVVIVTPPQNPKGSQVVASRVTAMQNGVAAASGGDPRVLFIDTSSTSAADGWQAGTGFAPYGIVTFASNPGAGDTVTIGGTAVTFVASAPSGNQVLIGSSLAVTLVNLQNFLVASTDSNLRKASYTSSSTTLTVWAANSAVGTGYTLAASVATVSGATLTTTGVVGDGVNDNIGAYDSTHLTPAGNVTYGRRMAQTYLRALAPLAP